jgi:hypothetical protein
MVDARGVYLLYAPFVCDTTQGSLNASAEHPVWRGHRQEAQRCPPCAALDINSFTPVRMLADCVGTTEVLQY